MYQIICHFSAKNLKLQFCCQNDASAFNNVKINHNYIVYCKKQQQIVDSVVNLEI